MQISGRLVDIIDQRIIQVEIGIKEGVKVIQFGFMLKCRPSLKEEG